MKCGQNLPEGAAFCFKCGTPFGSVSVEENHSAITQANKDNKVFVPAMCPNCNAHLKVNSTLKIAHCDSCGTECLVQDAIKTLNIKGNVHVANASINVNGSSGNTNIETLLSRVEIMLSDGNFNGAMEKCNKLLDLAPTDGRIYLFMLMSFLNCKERTSLKYENAPFDLNHYYVKLMKYGNKELKDEIKGYLNSIIQRTDRNQKKPQIGSEIYFGTKDERYIWWRVLDLKNGMALIASKDILYNSKFNNVAVSWKDSYLRQWLNSDFINTHFSSAEKERIVLSNNTNEDNPKYKTKGGGVTSDKVFLLSISEASRFFSKSANLFIGSTWWLRSPGKKDCIATVETDGRVNMSGWPYYQAADSYSSYNIGVRPVMWIKLDPSYKDDGDYCEVIRKAEEEAESYKNAEEAKARKAEAELKAKQEIENKKNAESYSRVKKLEKSHKKIDALEKVFEVLFYVFRVILVLWAIFAICYAFAARTESHITLITVVFLLLISSTTLVYRLHCYEWWNLDPRKVNVVLASVEYPTSRPVVCGAIEYMFFSLIVYIFKSEYAKRITSYLLKQLILVIAVILISFFAGYVINKLRDKWKKAVRYQR